MSSANGLAEFLKNARELTEFLKNFQFEGDETTLRANGINSLDALDTATDDFLRSIGIPKSVKIFCSDIVFTKFLKSLKYEEFETTLRANGINSLDKLDTATDDFLKSIGIPILTRDVFRDKLLQRNLFRDKLLQKGSSTSAASSSSSAAKPKSPDALAKFLQKHFIKDARDYEDKLRVHGINSVDKLYAASDDFLRTIGIKEFNIRRIRLIAASSSAASSSAASSSAASSSAASSSAASSAFARHSSPDALAKLIQNNFSRFADVIQDKLRTNGINSVEELYAAPRSFLESIGLAEFDIRKILKMASSSVPPSSPRSHKQPKSPRHSPGSPKTQRVRPSPRDCIKEFRRSAQGYIESDVESQFEIVSLQPNPHAAAGTPLSNNFCDQLDALRDAVSKGLKVPNQVVILAYHGTDLRTVDLILRSHVKQGDRNMYGKGAYFTTDINIAEYFSMQKPTVRGTFYVIVSALILKPDSYTFEPPNARHPRGQEERPLSYIVNKDVQVQLPLFSMELRRKGPKRKAYGTEIAFEGPYSRISGNSSTNTRNVDFGGTRKKRKPKHTVLFMTLDGKVGVKKT